MQHFSVYFSIISIGLLVINIYVFFAFNYMQADFWMDNVGPSGEGTCSTMIHCFLTVFSLGPRSSGSIGDVMTDISYSVRLFY